MASTADVTCATSAFSRAAVARPVIQYRERPGCNATLAEPDDPGAAGAPVRQIVRADVTSRKPGRFRAASRVCHAVGEGAATVRPPASAGARASRRRRHLARRAPEDDALARRVGAERSAADQGAAAPARPAFAPVHPGRAAGPGVARERAVDAIAVGADHAGSEIDDGRGIRLVRRCGGKDAAHEEDLVGVLVAEPGDAALVLQGDVDGSRVGAEAPRRLGGIPVVGERIGPEVADEALLVARWGRARSRRGRSRPSRRRPCRRSRGP